MKDKLKNLYSSLPQHKAPDHIWNQLEAELGKDIEPIPMDDHHSHSHGTGWKLWASIAATILLGVLAISISLIQSPEPVEEVSLEKKLPNQKLSEEAEVMYQDELLLSREEQIQQLNAIEDKESATLQQLQADWQALVKEDPQNIQSAEADAILHEFSQWLMKHPEKLLP
ncbi:MAG: hypothetical protein AAF655_11165 [Bacteroidota bacterium]